MDSQKIDLTVCIATIPSRKSLLHRLLAGIESQLVPNVEVVVAGGNGPQGKKLNACFERARGTYVVAVDDDDMLADDYISSVSQYFDSDVDYIGYRIKWMQNGVFEKSIGEPVRQFPFWCTAENRGVCPKCLTKKDIMVKQPFGDNYTADLDWSLKIFEHVKSFSFIEKDLYIYDHWNQYAVRTSPDENERTKQLSRPQRFVGTFDIDPLKYTWITIDG